MNDADPIRAYLVEFSRLLSHSSRNADRVRREVEDHLYETADELCRQGIEPRLAAARAVERFGAPVDVLEQFTLEAPIECEVDVMFRYLLMPTAAITCAFGALFFVFSFLDDAPPAVFAAKIVAATVMIGCSVILFRQGWTTKPLGSWNRWLALAAALASIAIGSAHAVWTTHLGLVTMDWEYYSFVAAGLMGLQGVFAVMELLNVRPPTQLV